MLGQLLVRQRLTKWLYRTGGSVMQPINEGLFNLLVSLASLLVFILIFFLSETFQFYDVAGLLVAALGLRNIVAYHLKFPYLWWYGYRQDLKTNSNFQKQIYFSNYAILLIGVGYIIA